MIPARAGKLRAFSTRNRTLGTGRRRVSFPSGRVSFDSRTIARLVSRRRETSHVRPISLPSRYSDSSRPRAPREYARYVCGGRRDAYSAPQRLDDVVCVCVCRVMVPARAALRPYNIGFPARLQPGACTPFPPHDLAPAIRSGPFALGPLSSHESRHTVTSST